MRSHSFEWPKPGSEKRGRTPLAEALKCCCTFAPPTRDLLRHQNWQCWDDEGSSPSSGKSRSSSGGASGTGSNRGKRKSKGESKNCGRTPGTEHGQYLYKADGGTDQPLEQHSDSEAAAAGNSAGHEFPGNGRGRCPPREKQKRVQGFRSNVGHDDVYRGPTEEQRKRLPGFRRHDVEHDKASREATHEKHERLQAFQPSSVEHGRNYRDTTSEGRKRVPGFQSGDAVHGHTEGGEASPVTGDGSFSVNHAYDERGLEAASGLGTSRFSGSPEQGGGGDDCCRARWPTPGSVCSSPGYKKFAIEAGDDPDGLRGATAAAAETVAAERLRTRIRTRTRTRTRTVTGTEGTRIGAGTGLIKGRGGTHPERDERPSRCRRDSSPTPAALRYRDGGGGGGVPGGVERLEGDLRGAMVAVWLAWGVRIDAARARRQRDQRILEAGHRAQTAKVSLERARGFDHVWRQC